MIRLVEPQRHPDLRAARKVEALRHHADNGAREAIQRDRSSDDFRVAAQAALPEGVAHNRDVGRMASFFPGRKITPHSRQRAHHPEERCRDHCRVQLLGPFHAGPVCRNRIERCHLFEDTVPVAQTVVIGRRTDILLSGPGALADPVDSLGAGIGERANQDGVRHAEKRCVRADADGECQGGGEYQQRIANQAANGVRRVMEQTDGHDGSLHHDCTGDNAYPPAIAPTTRKGSAPVATASGSGASGDSWDRSSCAGEEPHERPALLRDVIADRAAAASDSGPRARRGPSAA